MMMLAGQGILLKTDTGVDPSGRVGTRQVKVFPFNMKLLVRVVPSQFGYEERSV